MASRIQVVLNEEDREHFREAARREGLSLSAWMRKAAIERIERRREKREFEDAEQLAAFFAGCDRLEVETEPSWSEHRRVIERSIRNGGSDT
jgi:predicted kinase